MNQPQADVAVSELFCSGPSVSMLGVVVVVESVPETLLLSFAPLGVLVIDDDASFSNFDSTFSSLSNFPLRVPGP